MDKRDVRQLYSERFPKSKELHGRAVRVFRNGITHDARFVEPFPIYMTHGKGSHVWDVDGHEYIDYFGGHGALLLGHAHPSLIEAVNNQIVKGTHLAACHELEIEWGELIMKLIPSAERVEFTNSGTEANMLAVRLARAFTGRNKIVRFRGQMGGWYDALKVGGSAPWNKADTPGILPCVVENTIAVPVNDSRALEETLCDHDVALLVCEPTGAYSGVTGIAPSFFKTMRDLTVKHQTLLLFDEVVSGFRYSPGGVQAAKGIIPDITSLGKNITGGLPGAGAVAGRADIMDLLSFKDEEWNLNKRISHQGTFNGNPLCAAAGVAALKVLSTGEPQKKARDIAMLLRKHMEEVIQKRNINGCAYSDGGATHLHFGDCEIRDKCDKIVCLNSTKVRPELLGRVLSITLTLNGIHTVNRGMDFFVSSTHSQNDINVTRESFGLSLSTMLSEGALNGYV